MRVIATASQIEIAGEELTLLPDRAIYWAKQHAVLVADLHVGKATAFRAESVPVPAGSSETTLTRLSKILQETRARRLYILGDFWHAKQGRTDRIHSLIASWRSWHPDVEMCLVEGNHDKKSGALPPELEVCTEQDLTIGGLVLKHHPEEDPRGYVLAGHIHPAVRLVGAGRQSERLPCFWFSPRVGVLPAFGEFTGAATVYPAAGDRVFVVAGEEICEVGLTGTGSA
ncbi:MAG: uncharacterized protein QOJ65_1272 [Fimbriimonadaceae bacterium]|nr:uncharacterized protein [Fimbriimonadaceae bacterium]